MLAEYPEMSGVGIDLSELSIEYAGKLLDRVGASARAELHVMSFSEPLPWTEEFDVAVSNGAIHHSPDPARSMSNIAASLKPGGILGAMIYGERSHRQRYELREALQIMSGSDVDRMYSLYLDYGEKYSSILDKDIRTLARDFRHWAGRIRQRLQGKEEYLGYDHKKYRKELFYDGFVNPIDRAYSSLQLYEMLEGAKLTLLKMPTVGDPDISMLPESWRERWRELDQWAQIRVLELINPMPESFSFIAQKRS